MSTSKPTGRRESFGASVSRRALRSFHCAWLLLGAVHCTAMIDRPGGGTGNGATLGGNGSPGGSSTTGGSTVTGTGSSSAPGNGVLDALTCNSSASPDPGPTPLNQLSRTQYLNTLSNLFTSVPDLTAALGADTNYSATFGFVQADIDSVQITNYQTAAETVAAAVVANSSSLAKVAPCASGADQRTCAQNFVQSFGALAYRSPITDSADIARHLAMYDQGATVSYAHGIELVLRGMLQSPRFLYRIELGTSEKVGDNAVKLSPYEIAARLAYVVWDGPPDSALTSAAAAGQLATPDQLQAQLTRMLADPKGASFVQRFVEGWTQLSSLDGVVKDATVYPEWTATGSTLEASQKAQAQAFFKDVLGTQDGKLSALLTSQKVFVNKDLASYYGASSSDASFTSQTYAQASGMLTLPAFLSLMAKPDESWPIYRGKFVREQVLCQLLPAPPANVPKPPDVQPGVSTRERLTQHETDPTCAGCHKEMDPIGLGFEAFDGIGRYRTSDGGQPVDASGALTGTDVDATFNGVADLGSKLAASKEVEECVAAQWFRYTMNRYEQSMDGCSMKGVLDAFDQSGKSLNALPQAIVASNAFLYRRPIEVSQ